MTKSEAKALRGGYIPDGPEIDLTKVTFRKTEEHEVHRCGAKTSYDVQSGQIYCGDIADWINASIIPGHVAAVCDRHADRLHIKKV